MLSRHFLRAKALQSLYAGVTSKTPTSEEVAKLFDLNVGQLNNLGIIQLSTLSQLTFTAERINETASQKFMPTESEKNPSTRFSENIFIERLSSSFEFNQKVNRMKIDWSNHFDVFRKILTNLKTTNQYKTYASGKEQNFQDDKEIAIVAFKCLMNDDTLREIIFDRDLMWEDDFDQIAQYNLMLIKEMTEENLNEAMRCPLMHDDRASKDINDYNFARELVVDTYNQIEDNQTMIRKYLQNWDMERVALMDIILINMAITEFTCCPSIPERVTVDEYIELSKEFSTEKSKLFINGILDKLLIELRVAGRIVKNSRGLYDPEIDGDVVPEG